MRWFVPEGPILVFILQPSAFILFQSAAPIASAEWFPDFRYPPLASSLGILHRGAADFFAGDGYQNPRDLDENNYTLITYSEEPEEAQWVFGRLLCMHCASPACVSACPTGALQKLANGPVELTEWRCIGCRYCIQACPFVIPKFNYDSPFPKIHKCTFCSDRLAADLEPACAKVCPTNAIEFGDRDDMLSEAKRRIADAPGRYVPHIYGKDEVGGTNVLHLSSVPFEKLGYETGLPTDALPNLTHKSMRFVPALRPCRS